MRFLWLVAVLMMSSCDGQAVSPSDQKQLSRSGLPEGCSFLSDEVDGRFSKFAETFFREEVGVSVESAHADKGFYCGSRKVFPIRAMTESYPHERVWFVEIADGESNAVLIRPE